MTVVIVTSIVVVTAIVIDKIIICIDSDIHVIKLRRLYNMDQNSFTLLQDKTLINHKEKISKLFLLFTIFIIVSCTPPNPTFIGGSGSPFIAYSNGEASDEIVEPLEFKETIIDEYDTKHIFIRNKSSQNIDKFSYELPFGFRDEDTFNNPNIDSDIISCTAKKYLDPSEICRISIRFQPNAKDNFSGTVKISVRDYTFELIKIFGEGLNNTALEIPDRGKLKLGFIEKTDTVNQKITLIHNKQTLEPITFRLITQGNKIENNNVFKVEYAPIVADSNSCVLENDNRFRDNNALIGTLRQGDNCTLNFKITINNKATSVNKFAYSSIIIKQDSFTDIIPVTGVVVKKNNMVLYTPTAPMRRNSHTLSIHNNKLILIGGAYQSTAGLGLVRMNDIWKYNGFSWDNITDNYSSTLSKISDTGSAYINDTTFLIGGRIESGTSIDTVLTLSKKMEITNNVATGIFPEKYSFAHALIDKYVYLLGGTDNLDKVIDNDTLRRLDTTTKVFEDINITNQSDVNRALLMAELNDKLYILSNKTPDINTNLMTFHVLDNTTSETYRDVTAGDNISLIFAGQPLSIKAPSRIAELGFVVRDNASIVTANNSIFVFGGKTSTGATNDMFIYSQVKHQPILDLETSNATLRKCCAFARDKLCSNTCEDDSPIAFAWAQFDNETNPVPRARYNAKMQAIGNNVYLFGGIAANNETRLNDLWKYETENYRWVKLIDNNDVDAIGGKVNQTSSVLTDNNKVCTLDIMKKAFYCYDMSTNILKYIEPKVDLTDTVSSGARIIYHNKNIYLFQAPTGIVDPLSVKLNVYNMDNNSWYKREVVDKDIEFGESILESHDEMALTIEGDFIYGVELLASPTRHIYKYDLRGIGAITKEIMIDSSPPSLRKNMEIKKIGKYLYLHGGQTSTGGTLFDTLRYEFDNPANLNWVPLNSLTPTPWYINHSLVELDGELYLIAGLGAGDTNNDKIYKFNDTAVVGSAMIGWEEVTGLTIPTNAINGNNQFIKFNKDTIIGIDGSVIKVLQIKNP